MTLPSPAANTAGFGGSVTQRLHTQTVQGGLAKSEQLISWRYLFCRPVVAPENVPELDRSMDLPVGKTCVTQISHAVPCASALGPRHLCMSTARIAVSPRTLVSAKRFCCACTHCLMTVVGSFVLSTRLDLT